MKGFFLGLLVASLGFGAFEYWRTRQAAETGPRVTVRADAGPPAAKKRRRRAARVAVGAPESEAPEPIKLSAADLKNVGQGDDLSRPDVVRLDFGESGSSAELSQEEIDQRFRAQEDAILDCIARARPDEEAYVPGRVTVKFRIQRTGAVRGVRVDAPAILQRGGLYGCIRGVVGRMSFPASGGSQVVTYPFSLS